jgi:hypothetical protein
MSRFGSGETAVTSATKSALMASSSTKCWTESKALSSAQAREAWFNIGGSPP